MVLDPTLDVAKVPSSPPLPGVLAYLLVLGLFLTCRGYHSRDGDQAYRLPLLLHRQDPSLFRDDPFVLALDAFNPHRGYLTLLDLASRPLGLSVALAVLFALTFGLTCRGLDHLGRAAWPDSGPAVGLVAVALALIAKAGNIGTNHLFEAMLLDRLIGFALGWIALALAVGSPRRGFWVAPLLLGLAAFVHPSVGLQLAMLLGAVWVAWAACAKSSAIGWREAAGAVALLVVGQLPALAMNLGQRGRLFAGLPEEEFRALSVTLQGPQHMLPHLWRMPQWLAWACYPVLALISIGRGGRDDCSPVPTPVPARARLRILLEVNLAGLALAWVGVECLHDLRITLFQPFRMATVFRGLALVALSGRVLELWRSREPVARLRTALLVAGLGGDWAFVVATLFDLTCEAAQRLPVAPVVRAGLAAMVLLVGLWFLSRHDTESGHLPLLAAVGVVLALAVVARSRRPGWSWNRRRIALAALTCWAVPLSAAIVAGLPMRDSRLGRGLVERCRFTAIPTDDIERLAVWSREHTPADARFIGPPGPKTFRLWSLRSLAFNRAASPYHAAGLADWSARFGDHVGLAGSTDALVRAYLADRHGLERRYQEMTAAGRAALAARQGATHVVAAAPTPDQGARPGDPLELLHVEGRYAVYRVRGRGALAHRDRPETPR